MIGFFGKIPAHGDFVSRDLSNQFVADWDQWLQAVIPESRTILAEDWLDTYLVSPIWRFVVSKGIISDETWCGVLLPSVDSVGRYFPLTIAFPLGISISPCEFLAENDKNFAELESECREALEGSLSADCLSDNLRAISFAQVDPLSSPLPMQSNADESNELFGQGRVSGTGKPFFGLMEKLLRNQYSNYSLWTNANDSRGQMFAATGLPSGIEFVEMLKFR